MKDNLFELEILTPEHRFFKGEVEAMTFTAEDGEWTILANHAPLVAALRPNVIRWKVDGVWTEAINAEGYMEVTAHKVVLFCHACEWPENIDQRRAEEARRQAEEAIRQARSRTEHKNSQIQLARAMARLRNVNHTNL